MSVLNKLMKVKKSGRVIRLHTDPQHTTENCGEHSWGVAMLLLQLYPRYTREMMENALLHDVGEADTGDIPSNVKWYSQELSRVLLEREKLYIQSLGLGIPVITDLESTIIEVCDKLDFALYCYREVQRGNRDEDIVTYINRSIDRIQDLISDLEDPGYERLPGVEDNHKVFVAKIEVLLEELQECLA